MKTILKRSFLILTLVFLSHYTFAARYHFSSQSGDDSRSNSEAQNPATPWKSINKLNAIFSSLQPGDEILFKRGETFYGSIHITKSGAQGRPIVFGAFGNGNKPVITSLVTLNNWVNVGNGVFESHNASFGPEVNVVLLNNDIKEMGRYPNSDSPNKGYLTFESTNGSNSITSNILSSTGNWTGGEVVIRKSHWTIDRYKINQHSGNLINFTKTAGRYNPVAGYGFFIQGHPNTLDKFGEWYYNPSSKKLRVFFGSTQPSSVNVQASTFNNLVTNAHFAGHIVFDNLNLKGANKYAIELIRSNNFQVKNCDIEFSGENGITLENTPKFTLENSKIFHSNNNGVDLRGNTADAIIKNNRIENTGISPGMGLSGVGNGLAIQAGSDNNLIEYNDIINTGYIGIRFGGNNTVVKNNFINNYCLIKDDGAGIYTWTGSSNKDYHGRKIVGNVIVNGIGAKEGTPASFSQAEGIYLDDNVSGVDITDNTIANASGKGIYIHNTRNIVLKNNTFFNNGIQLRMSHDNLGYPIRNATVTDNIFFSKKADQLTSSISSVKDDLKDMGTFDRNYYARPIDDVQTIMTQKHLSSGRETDFYDLLGWKKELGKDQNSNRSPVKIPTYEVINMNNSSIYPHGSYNTASAVKSGIHGRNSNLSWVSSGKLEAGTLQVSGKGSSSVTISAGALKQSKHYVLKFNAMASKDAIIKVLLMQSNAPYGELAPKVTLELKANRGEYEAIFPIEKAEGASSIRFESENGDFTYWLDNVTLHEAEARPVNPDDYIRFEYNPTNSNKSISLDGNFVDVKNIAYSGNVTLGPYSSKVLIRTSKATAPVEAANKAPKVIITSPTNNSNFDTSSSIDIKADAGDEDGTISKVDFYNGTTHIGTATSAPYTITWQNVPKGNHNITAKATDNNSLSSTSEPVAASVNASIAIDQEENTITPPKDPSGNFSLFLNTGSDKDLVYSGDTFVGDLKFPSYYDSKAIFSNSNGSPDELFQTERNGEKIAYSIPVPNGTYTIKTYHSELWFGKLGPKADAANRVFNISLEGDVVKRDFDKFVENSNQQNVLVFENIEVTDGILNLDLVASKNKASISGIAILSGTENEDEMKPPTVGNSNESSALYLNTGNAVNVEFEGNIFLGDNNFNSYYNSPYSYTNRNASEELLFQTERLSTPGQNSELNYSIPLPNGTYTVKTYHHELFFGKIGPSASAGRRVFDISIEGKLLKDNFDKYLESSDTYVTLTFENIEVKDGNLDIDMLASKNRVSISGIAIIPNSSLVTKKLANTAAHSVFYNTGSDADIEYEGVKFSGDRELSSLFNNSHVNSEQSASQDVLFQTERNAISLNYSIPLPNGTYTVQTYHNELWFGKRGPSASAGRRVFDISIENEVVKNDFDMFLENGNKQTVLTFVNIEVKDGILNLDLLASRNRASISGIAIFGGSSSTAHLRMNVEGNNSTAEEEIITPNNGNQANTLYPNPASGSTTLSITQETKLTDILIHDMSGQLMQQLDPLMLENNQGSYTIPLNGMPQGVYLVSLVGQKEMINQLRLIVRP